MQPPKYISSSSNIDLTALPAATAWTNDDLLLVGDDPSGSYANKKITRSNFKIAAANVVSAHTLATFTNNAGTTEIGNTVDNFTFSWTYNRNTDNPTSQSIAPTYGTQAVALRSLAVTSAGLTTTTAYTLSAVGDDGTASSLATSVLIQSKRYYGISASVLSTDAQVLAALSGEFGTAKAVSKTFDASAGSPPNYLYYCYPTAWGAISASTFGGFAFTDYTVTTIVGFTNASGYVQNYYLVRTNNVYVSSGLVWAIT